MSESRDIGQGAPERRSLIDHVIRFCLENKLVVALVLIGLVAWGVLVAPFDWKAGGLQRSPVPVDAIPDIGENQQIVFTEWMGRSPQDVDDQVTYPLTTALMGLPSVKTIRSFSFFGFSTIYVIFEENRDFYWTRSRILEKLNSLPPDILPEGVQPTLGPDATALGQIFWYTLEGRDPDGKPVGGWDLNQLRTVQDWYVRYHLLSAEGIAEVAPVGGFVQEYQIDVDPDAMRAHGVTLQEVFEAVRASNVDVGARAIELNKVEYLIRGRGFIRGVRDIENTVVKVAEDVPICIRNVATVTLGPQMREGALDKGGAEAVGGVVVVRHGYNPLEAIKNVKAKITEVAPSLPVRAVIDFQKVRRAQVERFAQEQGLKTSDPDSDQGAWLQWLRSHPRAEWPQWLTTSQVTVVPFYDRTGLIYETLGTLNAALYEEVLVTIIVIIVMAARLRMSLMISAVMPLAVLAAFIAMKMFGVDANIVSLSGIAIAIGTVVDMGIVICQNIVQHLEAAKPGERRLEVIYRASSEVGGAVVTAIATTVVGFLPVFAMTGPEGKLFRPLAFTKTFCLIASVVVALTVIPAAAHIFLAPEARSRMRGRVLSAGAVALGVVLGLLLGWWWAGLLLVLLGAYALAEDYLPPLVRRLAPFAANVLALVVVGVLLTEHWLPLGPEKGFWRNFVLVAAVIGAFQLFYYSVERLYEPVLRWFLAHKVVFLCMPALIVVAGYTAWLGFDRVFGFVPAAAGKVGASPESIRETTVWVSAARKLPGFGKEFMPPLDEGSFLYMPTTMPHASIGEALDVIEKQDKALSAIPEVESVVGKIGRADTALDPAPMNMIETVITYKPEFITDKDGRRVRFRYDEMKGEFVRDGSGQLMPDPNGRPYRQWREHIRSPDDIWKEIVEAAQIPGTTSAPKLQPIAARIVMLQSGMRAPMGVKVKGPDLDSIQRASLDIERLLREVPSVEASAVIADRIIGKPYLEIDINREALARYGLSVRDVQDVIEVAIGGIRITTTVEGRERYPVRVRYMRELRDQIETMSKVLVPTPSGAQIPLDQLSEVRYVRGPESIKSEDAFLVGYVLFDKKPGYAEVDVVEACDRYLKFKQEKGELVLPAGVSYRFAGTYENQVHARGTLVIVLPLALFVIFMIIYFQFRSVVTTSLVFSSIFVCWGGGLLLLWLYGQPWFLDFSIFGANLRDLFHIHTINMSVAIWVGFLALFGIASDDAVVVCTYMEQRFGAVKPKTVLEVREATVYAGKRRIRACLMTTATTVLALLPVLTSTGRGSDILMPMAIPSFGGMTIEVITMFLAPVLYCAVKEFGVRGAGRSS